MFLRLYLLSYLVYLHLPGTFVCLLHYYVFHRAGDETVSCCKKDYILTYLHVGLPYRSLLHFPSLLFTPDFSTPAFFTSAIYSRIFQPCIYRIAFSTPVFSVATFPHRYLSLFVPTRFSKQHSHHPTPAEDNKRGNIPRKSQLTIVSQHE